MLRAEVPLGGLNPTPQPTRYQGIVATHTKTELAEITADFSRLAMSLKFFSDASPRRRILQVGLCPTKSYRGTVAQYTRGARGAVACGLGYRSTV